jgi:ABC-type molybdate transport system substrate-binding protein
MLWLKLNFLPSWIAFLSLAMAVLSNPVKAAEYKEIETITVLAETSLATSMAQISSLFTRGRPISVSNNFGDSEVQRKKIEDGESADIFITSQPDLVQQLKTKGLVDVYSIGQVASLNDKTYTIAVVAGENMTPARVFLEFLKSDKAKAMFKKHGFSTP